MPHRVLMTWVFPLCGSSACRPQPASTTTASALANNLPRLDHNRETRRSHCHRTKARRDLPDSAWHPNPVTAGRMPAVTGLGCQAESGRSLRALVRWQCERLVSRLWSKRGRLFASALAVVVLAGCGRQAEEPQSGKTQVIKTRCGMDMVALPAGQFTMGVSEGPIDAKPAHEVKVDAFLMDQTEITQEVYESVTGKN